MNIKTRLAVLIAVFVHGLSLPVQASSIAQEPLLNAKIPAPNLVLIFDDSTSMQMEMLPDSLAFPQTATCAGELMFPQTYASSANLYNGQQPCWNHTDQVRDPVTRTTRDVNFYQAVSFRHDIEVAKRRSSAVNRIYYDPEIHYKPWRNADNTEMAKADTVAAYWNPARTSVGAENLEEQKNVLAYWLDSRSTRGTKETQTYYLGTYYTLNYTVNATTGGRTYADSSSLSSYTRYEISPIDSSGAAKTFPKASTRDDCAGTQCTYREEVQNFANWFQYYRTRFLLARAAAGSALATQTDDSMRIGFASLGFARTLTNIDGQSSYYLNNGVRSFSGSDRQNIFAKIYNGALNAGADTYLRGALDTVGQYFTRTGAGSPWTENPAGTDSASVVALSCRRSYALIVTDGMWRSETAGVPDVVPADDSVDNVEGPEIVDASDSSNIWHYTPSTPYKDAWKNTLADIAMYYWNRDLQPGIPNAVQATITNEAFWQHLSTYTVGLGVDGALNSATDLPNLISGSKSWPEPRADTITTVDDLWHAAINSRASYFSAKNYTELSNALGKALSEINDANGTTGGSISESRVFSSNSGIFYSNYDPSYWAGDLKYRHLNTGSSATRGALIWAASEKVPLPANRSIFTKTTTGSVVPFRWNELSSSQRGILTESDVDYLRGNPEWEVGSRPSGLLVTDSNYSLYKYRTRRKQQYSGSNQVFTNVLGDILGSNVALIGKGSDYAFDVLPSTVAGQSSYLSALDGFSSRSPVIYVGANDGMLHAFNAVADSSGGGEKFAYIPRAVLNNLKSYAYPGYSHRMFVNGPLEPSDAYLTVDGTAAWRTVLLGMTGAGGRAIYALDVTDPSSLGASSVLWEHDASESGYEGLGYTLSAPRIGVVATTGGARWVAIVPNGYESGSDSASTAQLFVLHLSDGSILARIDTGVGDSTTPNGLGSVEVRLNEQREIVAAYAGDKLGNLWKFDLSSASIDEWNVSRGAPLFTAKVGSGTDAIAQPITARPTLWKLGSGQLMVVFGTGKLFEETDGSTSLPVAQTIYAVAEPETTRNLLRSNLHHITSTKVFNSDGGLVGVEITGTPADLTISKGWYLDIDSLAGERVIAAPVVIGGVAYVTSFAPSANSCEFGGASILYALDVGDGAAPSIKQFEQDVNGLKIAGTTGGLNYLFSADSTGTDTSGTGTGTGSAGTDTSIGVSGASTGNSGNIVRLVADGVSVSGKQIVQSLGGSRRYWRGNWKEITQ